MWNKHNGANQKWNVIYTDSIEKPDYKGLNKDFGFEANRPFYIVSRMAMNRVIEWRGSGNILITKHAGRNTQKFIFDG